jgi:hypothetical protein
MAYSITEIILGTNLRVTKKILRFTFYINLLVYVHIHVNINIIIYMLNLGRHIYFGQLLV